MSVHSLVSAKPSLSSAPRAAVVIPCFNDGETVIDAVRSVQDQEACELVVVNDGSTDRATLNVLSELVRSGCEVVHQRNRGTSAARMTGVWATTAPYVFPLDADDALLPGAVAALADTLDAQTDVAAVWGGLTLFGEVEPQPLRRRPARLDPWRITYFNNLPYSALFKRNALLAVGGWSLSGPYQDWDLWMSLAEAGYRASAVERPVHRYRLHGPRQFARGAAQHDRIYAELRNRHPRLFAERRRNWLRSSDPWRVRLAVPLAASIPGLAQRHRHRLFTLADSPREAADKARLRLRRGRSHS
ncbi:MAG TPA: glycosyltransferase family A protein [Thermoleophilaceae bacterium]|nr:glycosyltransferase family A protein [Thermoleophilaceae bacterium]